MKTKKDAISHAKRCVTDLYKIGGNWAYQQYDPKLDGWWAHERHMSYWAAQSARKEALIYEAVKYLHDDEEKAIEAMHSVSLYGSGRWEKYVI